MPISRGRVFFLCPYLPYPSARHRRAYLPPRPETAARPPKPRSVLPSDWEERPPPRRAISIEPRFAAFRALCAHISRRLAYLPARANTRPHIASIDPARMTITKQSIIPPPLHHTPYTIHHPSNR